MISTPRFLTRFLAFAVLVSTCLPVSPPVVVSANGPGRPRTVASRFNSLDRISVSPQQETYADRREGEILIKFRRGVTIEEQRSIAASIGALEFRVLRGKSRVVKLVFDPGRTFEAVALSLRYNSSVEAAEPNYLVYKDSTHKAKPVSTRVRDRITQWTATPNDPWFSEQWALQNLGGNSRLFGSDIQIVNVWQHFTGNPELPIAVIDSGISFTHPDLRNQQWSNSKEATDGKDNDLNEFVITNL